MREGLLQDNGTLISVKSHLTLTCKERGRMGGSQRILPAQPVLDCSAQAQACGAQLATANCLCDTRQVERATVRRAPCGATLPDEQTWLTRGSDGHVWCTWAVCWAVWCP